MITLQIKLDTHDQNDDNHECF